MSFESFWLAYPRKVGRMKAEKIWRKLTWQEQEQAYQGITLWKQSEDWRDPLFIPHASTFLNQRRWEEEPVLRAMTINDPGYYQRTPTPEQAERDKRQIAEILKRYPDLA